MYKEGIDSGVSDRTMDDILNEARQLAHARAGLRDGWFTEEIAAELSLLKPGIYQWSIDDVGLYVGKSKDLRNRLKAYPRNVANMIQGRNYHGNPDGKYRLIHHSLLQGHNEERRVRFTILENCDEASLLVREQHWIALRRADERKGGPKVLNAT